MSKDKKPAHVWVHHVPDKNFGRLFKLHVEKGFTTEASYLTVTEALKLSEMLDKQLKEIGHAAVQNGAEVRPAVSLPGEEGQRVRVRPAGEPDTGRSGDGGG